MALALSINEEDISTSSLQNNWLFSQVPLSLWHHKKDLKGIYV